MKTQHLVIAIAALVVTTCPSYALTKAEAKAHAAVKAKDDADFETELEAAKNARYEATTNAANAAYIVTLAAVAKIKWISAARILKIQGGDDASQANIDHYEDVKANYELAKSRAALALAALPDAELGMTEEQVRETNWGEPTSVNRTTMVNHVREQWVYTDDDGTSRRFLYFDNGRLTAIQN